MMEHNFYYIIGLDKQQQKLLLIRNILEIGKPLANSDVTELNLAGDVMLAIAEALMKEMETNVTS